MPVRSVYRAIVAACVVRFACVVQCALQGYVEYNTTHSVSFTAYPRHALCLSCGGHGCMFCVYCAIVTPVNTSVSVNVCILAVWAGLAWLLIL